MLDRGILIVISGPSGTGKGTVCKELIKKGDYWLSVSATTRSPRAGEIQNKSYYFLSEEEFKSKIKSGDFLEYANVYGNYYGTPKSNVLEKLDLGYDVILEIDIQGALKVKKSYPEGVFIFLLPPSMGELKNRIINRGSETQESLNRRFKSAYDEINYISEYNYAVVNDTIDNAVFKIQNIIEAEKCKVDRIKESILKLKEELIYGQFYDWSINSRFIKSSK